MKINKFLILIICSSVILLGSVSGEVVTKERNILSKKVQEINFGSSLVTDDSWIKIPTYKDREFWEKLPRRIKDSYILSAEKYLDFTWTVVKATDYLEIIRSGNRKQEVYAAPSNALISLVMGELAEGKGRFLDQIINGVWYYSEQTWWGWSAHFQFQKAPKGLPDVNEPTVDLGVGEIACNLAWTWFLFKDEFNKIHPLIAQRLKQEILNKAVNPYLERNDFGYMGFIGGRPNNWNPWVNYNMLNCFMLLESDPERKRAGVLKIVNSLDKFLNGYPDDGGCDEGPSYWGAAGALLFENLVILGNITSGKFDVFQNSLVQNIGKYFYKVNIHAPYFINFADADAMTGGNPSSVYLYGKAIGDIKMSQFGSYLAKLNNWGEKNFSGKICDQLKNLVLLPEILHSEPKEALVPDFWLPDTEIAGARDREGSFTGFFFGAKGGNNNESHNHNDVGSCVLYYNGKPCLIDVGREEYTAKTFGPQRYEIWTMQSLYHNLPLINGITQKEGEKFKAKSTSFTADKKKAFFSTDISGAYPAEAKVKSWVRSYTLNRAKNFKISDIYELEEDKKGITSSNLITCCTVKDLNPGLLQFEDDGFKLNMIYNPTIVTPKIEFIPVTDSKLKNYWPKGVTRISLNFIKPGLKGWNEVVFSPTK